jgi:hypothetical protein
VLHVLIAVRQTVNESSSKDTSTVMVKEKQQKFKGLGKSQVKDLKQEIHVSIQ